MITADRLRNKTLMANRLYHYCRPFTSKILTNLSNLEARSRTNQDAILHVYKGFCTITLHNFVVPTRSVWLVIFFQETGVVHRMVILFRETSVVHRITHSFNYFFLFYLFIIFWI